MSRVIEMQQFSIAEGFREEVERAIRKNNYNKASGREGIHNEMLKYDPPLVAELLTEV